MRRFGFVVSSLLVLLAGGAARADLTTRALDAADGGGSPPQTALISWAGTVKQTTLPDLLQVAVRTAPALQTAKLDIEIANAQIQQTWGRHDWFLQLQANGTWSESVPLAGGVAIGSQKTFNVTADITHTIFTGGTFGVHIGTSYLNIDSPDQPLLDQTFWTDDVSVSFNQPLLRGRGRDVFDANERRARLSRDAAVLARRQAALDKVQQVIAGYWDLVLAQRQVAITEQSLTLARERLRITEIGASGGKIAQAEIPAVQQIIATRQEDVLSGELGVVDRSIALRRSVGMVIGPGELALRVDSDLEAADRGWTLDTLLDRAYAASPELAVLAKQEAGSTIEIEVNDNGLLPQLDLALSLGPSGSDGNPSTAAEKTFKFDEFSGTGSLTFRQGLARDDVKGRSRELRAQREKVRVNAADVRAQIAQAMAQAVAQIELAKRRVVLSQRAIDLAVENIRIETDRFNLGKSTNFDVLNRLEEQRQAELRKAQALIDWHKAEAVVMALTGDLLPAYGVTVE
ncbi:MAG: TolC family protein [Kofleriaceae bacterium]|nr:TolC family protein [Kofleriaceae bacterium]